MAKRHFESYREKGKGQWHGDLESGLPLEARHAAYISADAIQQERIVAGQRWTSTMEPELGLGAVTLVEGKRVTVSFQKGACVRQYSLDGAPIKRMRFQTGSVIFVREGEKHTIDAVEEKNGLLIYHCSQKKIAEIDLNDHIGLTTPLERVCSGHTGPNRDFSLRLRILDHRCSYSASKTRGFKGGRIQLIPHQLYIARKVADLRRRRVLLADEVGLGKTIEAALILHRLLICEYVTRALILVPQSLVHVWFVELLRKFNLRFRIYDESYHSTMHHDIKETVPLLDDPLVLGDSGFVSQNEEAKRAVLGAHWDLLIVDEAHRLRPGFDGFFLVKELSLRCRDTLFLTATPQQHGETNHFARLQLLDPLRYTQYDRFLREARQHRIIAELVGRLLDLKEITDADRELMIRLFPGCNNILPAGHPPNGVYSEEARKRLVAGLIDRYGTGRAMFRNTRSAVGGFRGRTVSLSTLDASEETIERVRLEFEADSGITHDVSFEYSNDERLAFLIGLVRNRKKEKFLLICSSPQKATAVIRGLKQKTSVRVAEFHEDLTLIQRDRNAAWFAEKEGARLLVCSEIGSEGRNFQFAHHLVLWDLPLQPDLLEQRIGRLDRIGQNRRVTIHVPVVKTTPYAVLFALFHEGLGLFDHSVSGAGEMFEQIAAEARGLLADRHQDGPDFARRLGQCIVHAQQIKRVVAQELEAGRDRLLELHSSNPQEAALLVTAIETGEKEGSFKQFALDLYAAYGIIPEEISDTAYNLLSTTLMEQDFPGLSPSRPLVTFDRKTACAREDMEFITPDHPSIHGCVDLFLASEKGRASIALWQTTGTEALLLDAVFVLECAAPRRLFADRFLPPTPIRIIVDHNRDDVSGLINQLSADTALTECRTITALRMKQTLLHGMYETAARIAEEKSGLCINQGLEAMQSELGNEADRLKALHAVNAAVRQEEIDSVVTEMHNLENFIRDAKSRLDAVRVIWRTNKKFPKNDEMK